MKYHATKTYRIVETWLQHFSARWRRVLLFKTATVPLVAIGQESGRGSEQVWTFWKREISPPLPGIELNP
jgi:hypothetical protein